MALPRDSLPAPTAACGTCSVILLVVAIGRGGELHEGRILKVGVVEGGSWRASACARETGCDGEDRSIRTREAGAAIARVTPPRTPCLGRVVRTAGHMTQPWSRRAGRRDLALGGEVFGRSVLRSTW
eukprot:869937-Prymnesium_polylepis.1